MKLPEYEGNKQNYSQATTSALIFYYVSTRIHIRTLSFAWLSFQYAKAFRSNLAISRKV